LRSPSLPPITGSTSALLAFPNEEILRWALLPAYLEKAQAILDGTISTRPWAYYPVIFSDGTAFAFWGMDWLNQRSQPLLHRDDPLS
jgi:hypothetical protein